MLCHFKSSFKFDICRVEFFLNGNVMVLLKNVTVVSEHTTVY
jgi:hypothetical protein